ncbi:hypothetical protein V5799_030109 [Amblyomma americanum]|uniref:acetylcholinesterase n=1 Tax=Amblyomma americanum TaxID=6943 RepID=A0AAQ4EPR5_AMBAM
MFPLRSLALIVSLSCLSFNCEESPVVSTSLGLVLGKQVSFQSHCADAYLGIPFAEPPVGKLRFRRPVTKKPWEGQLRTQEFSKPCFQRRGNVPAVPWQANEAESSEDCLYLNVWTPRNRSSNVPLPVMLWIHGGSYKIGSADLHMYDGTVLASYGQVVVVSTNYRLGAFGFMNANITDVPGNMGLWDQYFALRWVHDNAAAFGGDPSRVTVFGESVGGASAGMLAFSPLCKGLIRRIIMQSGTPRWPLPLENDGGGAAGLRLALDLSRRVGCSSREHNYFIPESVTCLLDVPPEEIAEAELQLFADHMFTFLTSFGDDLVPVRPHETIREARGLPVDVMLGTNVREGAILFFFGSGPNGVASDWTSTAAGIDVSFGRKYLAQVFAAFPKEAIDQITEHYLGSMTERSAPEDVFAALVSAGGNFLFNCPALFFADSFSGKHGALLAYKFDHRALSAPWPQEFESTHSDEIQFVFGVPLRQPEMYSREDVLISEEMMLAWASFAHTG